MHSLRELSTGLDVGRLLLALPGFERRLPRGDGSPVLVVPPYLGTDALMTRLRRTLVRLGWTALPSGLGWNTGDVPTLIDELAERVEGAAEHWEKPVRLVGWSLGGYLAREAARERPDDVDRVVTLASPVVGGPKYTTVAELVERTQGVSADEIETTVAERERARPLRVPVTAVYSRRDGIVDWPACIDRVSGCTNHVEVGATHVGIVFHPGALEVVAEALAA